MKVSYHAISDVAYETLSNGVNGDLGNIDVDIHDVEKAEIALHIKRCLANGRKRITFEILGSTDPRTKK